MQRGNKSQPQELSRRDLGAEDALLEVDRQLTAGKAPFCLLL